MANLVGSHDRESVALTPADTWILDTIALSENPAPMTYDPKYHWIVRVNWGYGSTGTIPEALVDTEFLYRLSKYVAGSKNNQRWQIGNEPNLPREWPNSQPIHPFRYAEFFVRCADVIHGLPGHEKDEVLIAASGPWNNEYKYQGNPNGDWIKYFTDCIGAIPADKIGGFSIHGYTHGYDRSLVTSQATMNSPFENRYYNFLTYRDYCNAIPDRLADLPLYLTESNGDGPWQAVGIMPEMAKEIDNWNRTSNKRKIKCLIFYRYPQYDHYNIQGKPDVEKEYLDTVALGFKSPDNKILIPEVKNMPPEKILGKGTVTAFYLNVRNMPTVIGSMIIGSRSEGNSVEIYEIKDGWYRIAEDQWVSADWVSAQTLEKSDPKGDNWQRSLAFVLRWEGGWADDPNDPGGATMKGITIGTYTKWLQEKGFPAPTKDQLRAIPDSQVEEIYFNWYWLPSGANFMEWPMCLCQFDLAVNGGVGRAAEAYGINGNDFWKYMIWRRDWYRRLDGFKHFGKAWINRCKDLIMVAYE